MLLPNLDSVPVLFHDVPKTSFGDSSLYCSESIVQKKAILSSSTLPNPERARATAGVRRVEGPRGCVPCHADVGSFNENGHATISGMREGRFYIFWVYIMASRTGTLYIGMTGFVDMRIFQHKSGEIDGFTKKYKCDRLVYYEQYDDVYVAKRREQQLKGWRREKKIALIEKMNPRWEDLAENWGREMLFRGQSMKEKV